MYTLLSTGGFVLILNFQKTGKQQGQEVVCCGFDLQPWLFSTGSEKTNVADMAIIIIQTDKQRCVLDIDEPTR